MPQGEEYKEEEDKDELLCEACDFESSIHEFECHEETTMNKDMMTCDSDFDIVATSKVIKIIPFECQNDLFNVCLEDGWSISMNSKLLRDNDIQIGDTLEYSRIGDVNPRAISRTRSK